MARIKLVGFFRHALGKEFIEIQLEKPKKLIDLIGELSDKERAIILVNGKNADFTTEISNDDEVIIIPIIGGG